MRACKRREGFGARDWREHWHAEVLEQGSARHRPWVKVVGPRVTDVPPEPLHLADDREEAPVAPEALLRWMVMNEED